MKPYISIVTATYNSAQFLQRCIDSVASQTFKAVEHIVIDGASTDGTLEIIKNNYKYLSYWISEPDTGVYSAWNKAIPHIRGEWVLFLGSDDLLANHLVLENMNPHLEEAFPVHRLVYGKFLAINQNGDVLFVEGCPWEVLRREHRKAGIAIPPFQSTFLHASLFHENMAFDEKYKICGDYKFVAQEIPVRDPIFIPVEVTKFALGGLSSGLGRRELQAWHEDLRISRELDIRVPLWLLGKNYIKSILSEALLSLIGEKKFCLLVDAYRLVTFRRPFHTKNLKESGGNSRQIPTLPGKRSDEEE
jgi:glycosyltransferase involved in cell wall biosynthesis